MQASHPYRLPNTQSQSQFTGHKKRSRRSVTDRRISQPTQSSKSSPPSSNSSRSTSPDPDPGPDKLDYSSCLNPTGPSATSTTERQSTQKPPRKKRMHSLSNSFQALDMTTSLNAANRKTQAFRTNTSEMTFMDQEPFSISAPFNSKRNSKDLGGTSRGEFESIDTEMRTQKPPASYQIDDHRVLVTRLSESESEEEDEGETQEGENHFNTAKPKEDLISNNSTDNLIINSDLIAKLEAEVKRRTLLGIGGEREHPNNSYLNPNPRSHRRLSNRRKSNASSSNSNSSSGNVTPGGEGSEMSNQTSSAALILWKSPDEILKATHQNKKTQIQSSKISGYESDLDSSFKRNETPNNVFSKFQQESQLRRTFSSVSQEAELQRLRYESNPSLSYNQPGSSESLISGGIGSTSTQANFVQSQSQPQPQDQASPFSFGQVFMPGYSFGDGRSVGGIAEDGNSEDSRWQRRVGEDDGMDLD